ncbi:MAG: hypothetical protein ACP5I8_05015 [Phycisphaerae bacterium]
MKNINPLERHVEKLVLAIGGLFALWLIYRNFAYDPNQVASPVQPGAVVAPSDVSSEIIAQVRLLEAAIQNEKNRPINIGVLPNYVKKLVAKQTSPLPTTVVAISNESIGPYNTPLALTSGAGMQARGLTFMAPSVPVLPLPRAHQHQAVVYLPSPANANASGNGNMNIIPTANPLTYLNNINNPNGTSSMTTHGLFWVTVKTDFPMAKWMQSLAAQDIKLTADQAALPLPYRITAFYRVQVRRQRLLPNGRWSTWRQIQGLNLEPLPKLNFSGLSYSQRSTLLGQLDEIVSEVLDPAFYPIQQVFRRQIAAPQNVQHPHPMPQNMPPPNMPGMPGGMPGMPGGMPGMPGGMPGMPSMPVTTPHPIVQRRQQQPNTPALSPFQVQAQQSQGVRLPPLLLPGQTVQTNNNVPSGFNGFPSGFTPPGVSGANVNVATGPSSLTAMPTVPVRFYDTHVKPGDTYRYEIRVVMYNPVFAFPNRLNKPALRREQWLYSPWSEPSMPMPVNRDLYFFITSAQPADGSVSFQLFKWERGQWLDGSQTVHLGEAIGNKESISVIKSNGTLAPKVVDFATGYVLVDAVERPSGRSVNVVIEDPDYKLHLRNSAWDAANPLEQKLNTLSNQIGAPPPTNTNP